MAGFNLFDFNTPEKSKNAFLSSVATPATGGGMRPPTPQAKPLARTPQVVRKAQAEEEDVIQKFIDDKNIDSAKKKELGKALNEGADEAEVRTYLKQKYYSESVPEAPTPEVKKEGGTLKKIGGKIADSFMGGIDRIQEAGEGLANDRYNFAEAAMRGGAGAVESALSPISGLIGQGIESGIEKLSPETKKGISDFASPAIKKVKDFYSSQSPSQKRHLDNIGVGVEMLTNIVGGKAVQKGGEAILNQAGKMEKSLGNIAKRIDSPNSVNLPLDGSKPSVVKQAIPVSPQEIKAKSLYEGIAKVSTPRTKSVPQIKAELERGFQGVKEFVKRNPEAEVDVVKNFEEDIPNTLRKIYKDYTEMAKANKENLAGDMETTVENAISRHLSGLSEQSKIDLAPVIKNLKNRFGGLRDEKGAAFPLNMEQVQNELQLINADLRKSFTSGKSTLETNIMKSVVEDVGKLADTKLSAAYGGEKGVYSQIKSFADQTRNVWLHEMKRIGVKTEEELFEVLNNAGLAYDLVRAAAGSPAGGFWAAVKASKMFTDYLKDPTRNYKNMIDSLHPQVGGAGKIQKKLGLPDKNIKIVIPKKKGQ